MDARELMAELKKHHDVGWEFVEELRIGTGYGGAAEQRIDAWAIQCWRYKGINNIRRAFELKVNEGDIYNELRYPDKRWMAYAISHEFYFVAPAGLINPKQLTKDDGLIEWNGEKMRITKPARVRENMPPRWDFVASLVRTIKKR